MARRNKGNEINGWLILDKPQGLTSNQALSRLKRLFHPRKVGHAGTLDPLATGVLPIAFGEATKTVAHVVDCEKSYDFTIRWGIETDTDDAEGKPVRTSDARPTAEQVQAALPQFIGDIMQTPPCYSAIKVDGERAYDLARDGEVVELQPRQISVYELEIEETISPDLTRLYCDCGKGTYVRSIARDLGRALGCFGHIAALRRTSVGPFHEENAISLETLENLSNSADGFGALMGTIAPVETALDGIPALAVNGDDAARLKRGQSILIRGATAPILTGPIFATSRGVLIAIGEVERGEMHPIRVFNIPA
ncbi:tRNA pseudouridine(55) synthase TruB [Rhodomicrobium sp. Az07]|uniref:tRNA pseudouridine(55) synthase TruB n=1 Tax=Rhodomicrobium sp. Az07 TaxID=2839034 RepID=UPI001BE747D8|nr:tRNA pseudouridine(55) synthase TruB [Rhodomicrobium sp. Az07]MBT3070693.1 tRNA pseudouridine(55) synthase TruB [Rhodomicrobium sp. Az07]